MIIDINNMIGKRKIKPEITAISLISAMDDAKIDKSVIYCFAPVMDNDSVFNAIAKFPDRFIGLFTVNPWSDSSIDDLKKGFDQGFRGLHLDPIRHGFAINELDLLAPLFEACQQAGFPVWAYGAAEVFSSPILFQEVAENFLDVPIIMGHMGYTYEASSAMSIAKRNKNVFLDITGSMYSNIKKAEKTVPVEQILFGTGTPDFGAFETEIQKVKEAILEPKHRDMIFGENAAKIFRINK